MTAYRTREERRKMLHSHYYGLREKIFIAVVFLIIFVILISALILALQTKANILLVVMLAILIFIMVPVAAFMIDSVSYEME